MLLRAIYFVSLFSLLVGTFAIAQNPTPSAPHTKKYSLTNLRPVDVREFESNGLGVDHEYLLFRNERGTHYFIYEDLRSAPTLPELRAVRESMKNKDQTCQIELLCTLNAFCTGTCKNFYYELNNVGPDPSRPRQNHCMLQTFTCTSGGAKR